MSLTGHTLLHYHVLEKVGAGGMGEVYRARDTKLNRHVAIKALPAGFVREPEHVTRLKREAQILAALKPSQYRGHSRSSGSRGELVPGA